MEVPQWLVGVTPDQDEEMERFLVDYYEQEALDGFARKGIDLDDYARSVIAAEARFKALSQAYHLETISDRVVIRLTKSATKDGWWLNLRDEYGSVSEMLEEALAERRVLWENRKKEAIVKGEKVPPKPSNVKQLQSLVNIAKSLEAQNFPVEKIFGLRQNLTKARLAIPKLNEALDKEDSETVYNILDRVADDTIGTDDFEIYLKKGAEKLPAIEGQIFIIQNMNLLTIRCSDRYQALIEEALRGIVGFHLSDVRTLVDELSIYYGQKGD